MGGDEGYDGMWVGVGGGVAVWRCGGGERVRERLGGGTQQHLLGLARVCHLSEHRRQRRLRHRQVALVGVRLGLEHRCMARDRILETRLGLMRVVWLLVLVFFFV